MFGIFKSFETLTSLSQFISSRSAIISAASEIFHSLGHPHRSQNQPTTLTTDHAVEMRKLKVIVVELEAKLARARNSDQSTNLAYLIWQQD